MSTEMIETKLRNAARRAAVKFFVSGIDVSKEAEVSQAVYDFEDQCSTLDGDALASDIRFSNSEHMVWAMFEDSSVDELYDYYHYLVEDFVNEALCDL